MSKPQLASEPSMEEILSSIRKMISDDRPGPSPMPDQLSRMHFGEPLRSSSPANSAPAGPAQQGGGQGSSFNSLADALKVATALSDQRRSLQQEIASVLDKGPRRADPLSEAPTNRALPDAAPGADSNGPRLPNFPDWRSEAAGQPDGKRELMSFDFGTVVPQREGQGAKSAPAADAKSVAAQPSAEAEASKSGAEKAESKGEEPRVLSLRSTSGQNVPASGAANVAAFPRPVRETLKPTAEAAPASVEKAPEKSVKIETPVAAAEPAPEAPAAKMEAASAHTEALLDAVVDMVQQDPSSLSVFTSGASFISGVVDKVKGASKPVVADNKAAAPSVAGAPPKMDRAAAELLRPMLRQWLAENMPRIVEDALRSELTETQGDGKGPGKA
jgi:cell pole-organizing protein PopZ